MDKRPGLLPELIIPAGAIAFAIYYLSTVWELPFQAKVVGIYVASAIGLLSLLLFFRFRREILSGAKSLSFAGFFSDPVSEGRRWSVLALTFAFIGLMPVMGFVVTLFLFVFLAVIVIGGIGSIKGALAGAILVGLTDTLGRTMLPVIFGTFMEASSATTVGSALASMLIYILMAGVLLFKPTGLFGKA